MKKIFSIITMSLALFFVLDFGKSASAASLTSSDLTNEKALTKLQEVYPEAKLINRNDEIATFSSNNTTVSVTSGSAPPITSIDTFLVYSDATGDQDTWGLLSTPLPVAGYTEVYTLVVGYGNNYQYMNGVKIPLGVSTNFENYNEPVDLDGDTIVDGFLYGIAFNSDNIIPNGGVYKHVGNSYNYPWNTITSSFNITHQ